MLKPEILQVESTNDCFMNCKPCMRKHLDREIGYLDPNEFRRLPIGSFKEVCLHGWGEPLLHPKIFELVRYVKELGVKASLGTNGFLVKDRLEEILNSGLDEISFGIYTLKGREKAVEGVEAILECREDKPKVYIDITLMRENYDEIPELVDYFLNMGVDGVVIHRVFNVYKVDPDVEYVSPKEERELFKRLKRKKRVYLPTKHMKPCRVVTFTFFVTWDLKQCPCVYLSETYLGDARTSYLTMLKRHLKFVAGMRRHEICRRCFW